MPAKICIFKLASNFNAQELEELKPDALKDEVVRLSKKFKEKYTADVNFRDRPSARFEFYGSDTVHEVRKKIRDFAFASG